MDKVTDLLVEFCVKSTNGSEGLYLCMDKKKAKGSAARRLVTQVAEAERIGQLLNGRNNDGTQANSRN
jgi:hypothetical protein